MDTAADVIWLQDPDTAKHISLHLPIRNATAYEPKKKFPNMTSLWKYFPEFEDDAVDKNTTVSTLILDIWDKDRSLGDEYQMEQNSYYSHIIVWLLLLFSYFFK